MGRVLLREGRVRPQEFRQFGLRPVQHRHRERAGQGLPVGAQFRAEAVDLRRQFRRVVRAEGPDALRVVEFVEGDGGGVQRVRQPVPFVMRHAQHPAHPVPAVQQRMRRVRGLRHVRQQQAYTLRERLLRCLQLVVCFQGLRHDHPGRRVPGRLRADAVDDRSGLRLMAVLPEVRGLQGPDQVRVLQ